MTASQTYFAIGSTPRSRSVYRTRTYKLRLENNSSDRLAVGIFHVPYIQLLSALESVLELYMPWRRLPMPLEDWEKGKNKKQQEAHQETMDNYS